MSEISTEISEAAALLLTWGRDQARKMCSMDAENWSQVSLSSGVWDAAALGPPTHVKGKSRCLCNIRITLWRFQFYTCFFTWEGLIHSFKRAWQRSSDAPLSSWYGEFKLFSSPLRTITYQLGSCAERIMTSWRGYKRAAFPPRRLEF